jgi:NifB/MoaA-like Fe-S oxidoreductase
VEQWQSRYKSILGRDVIHLADEFYLVAGIELPQAEHYGEFPMLEDGVGLARSFINSFSGVGPDHSGRSDGFFSSVDSPTDYVRLVNPASDTGLRTQTVVSVALRSREKKAPKPLAVITGSYGAVVLSSVLASQGFSDVEVVEVKNAYFGGNTGVAGLLTYEDICAVLRQRSDNRRYLVPDVCLNDGVFLDGGTFEALSSEFDVEVIATSGAVLRKRLEAAKEELTHV